MRNSYPIESVDNALRLLMLLNERQGVRVSDAAEYLGVARSTAHRLLNALRYREFATQDAHRVYRPGPAFDRLARPGPAAPDLRAVLHPYVETLNRELGETCHLMVLEGNGVRFIDAVEGMHTLRVGSRVGMLLPAHRTSGGKALLAELSREEFHARYPRDLPGDTPRARAALERQLATIRRRGYATNFGESERGIAAVGACVHDASRRAVAGLAVAMPSTRCPRSRVPDLAAVTVEIATAASHALSSL